MKLRYADLFKINTILNKYLNINTENFFYLPIALKNNYMSFFFNKKLCANFTRVYLYLIFRFSLFFILSSFLRVFSLNKYKQLYLFLYNIEFFFLIRSFFLLYINAISSDCNMLLLDKQAFQYINYNLDYNNYSSLLNFILDNKVKFVVNFNSGISNSYLDRLNEFDVFFFSVPNCSKQSHYLFLSFMHYLKSLNKFYVFFNLY